MRKYSSFDLIRFANFSKKYEALTPIDRLKLYNKKYPELSAKQKWDNIKSFLGDELAEDIENAVKQINKQMINN